MTVSAIAKKAGLKNANHYIDATTIKTSEEMQRAVAECSVFGRVTPQQKETDGTGSSVTEAYSCDDR